jgi:hypothetical protein
MEKFTVLISKNLIWRIYKVDVNAIADSSGIIIGYSLSSRCSYTSMGRRYHKIPMKLKRRGAMTISNTFDSREDALNSIDGLVHNYITDFIVANQKMITELERTNENIRKVKPKGMIVNILPLNP